MAAPSLRNLSACIDDARDAFARDREPPGVEDRRAAFIQRTKRLPKPYKDGFAKAVLANENKWPKERAYYNDAVRAVVQRRDPGLQRVTRALQAAVTDVYHGFLSDLRRANAWELDHQVLVPLVAWAPSGPERDGPYTWPDYPDENIRAGIVVLPISHTTRALTGWSILAHEAAGHEIFSLRPDLVDEITENLRDSAALHPSGFGRYFAKYAEEMVCDVIGVLNLGPAAAIGTLAYFKGWGDAADEGRSLSRTQDDDHHPIGVLRALVMAQTILLLKLEEAEAWHEAILRVAWREYGPDTIQVRGQPVDRSEALEAATIVAQAISARPLSSLGRLTLAEIQNWKSSDEDISDEIREHLLGAPMPERFGSEFYPSHAIAAGVLESLSGRRSLATIFDRTIEILTRMPRRSQTFG